MNEEELKLFSKSNERFITYLDTPLGWRLKAIHDTPNRASIPFDQKDLDGLYCHTYVGGIARPYTIEDSEYGSHIICDDGKGGFRPATMTIVTQSKLTKEGKRVALRERNFFDHKGKFPKGKQIAEFLAEHSTTGFLLATTELVTKPSKEQTKAYLYERYNEIYLEEAINSHNLSGAAALAHVKQRLDRLFADRK